MKKISFVSLFAAAVLAASAAPAATAAAPICALSEGAVAPQVDALNALVLAGKFSDVTAALSKRMGGLPADLLAKLADAYPKPFKDCTVVAHRVDQGGLTQDVVVFEGSASLFVYWVSGPLGGEVGPISFNMNSSFDAILALLR